MPLLNPLATWWLTWSLTLTISLELDPIFFLPRLRTSTFLNKRRWHAYSSFIRIRMSSKLHRHAPLLRALHRANPKTRRTLLHKHCDGDFISCVVECVRNLLKGNVPLNPAQKKKLSSKKKHLRLMLLKKTSQAKKKKLIQSGGFLGALLGPIISILGGLFNGSR